MFQHECRDFHNLDGPRDPKDQQLPHGDLNNDPDAQSIRQLHSLQLSHKKQPSNTSESKTKMNLGYITVPVELTLRAAILSNSLATMAAFDTSTFRPSWRYIESSINCSFSTLSLRFQLFWRILSLCRLNDSSNPRGGCGNRKANTN